MATKTVKNEQSSTGTKKKTNFATVQTAKQQLTKKTDHFLFISTQQTVGSRNCKINSTISQQNSEKKDKLKKGGVRKLQSFIRLVVGYTKGMEKR